MARDKFTIISKNTFVLGPEIYEISQDIRETVFGFLCIDHACLFVSIIFNRVHDRF